MMGEHGATMGSARDLRARVILALISRSTTKATAGRAAALVEEARTIMAFIAGEADASALIQRCPIGPPRREQRCHYDGRVHALRVIEQAILDTTGAPIPAAGPGRIAGRWWMSNTRPALPD
jgi:hypothetical protein